MQKINSAGSVRLDEMVDLLDSSPATIRRDLAHLEEQGQLVRAHGGAVPIDRNQETAFAGRSDSCKSEKKKIAQRVIKDIPEGVAVFIDSGTTCFEAGRLLLQRGRNIIYTNSIPLLNEGCNHSGRIVSIGGEVRAISQALIGTHSTFWLQQIHFSICLMGASAISGNGDIRTTELQESAVKTMAMDNSEQKFLLADSSKCETSATVRFAKLNDFDRWYCSGHHSLKKLSSGTTKQKTLLISC